MSSRAWYEISNASEVASPALLIYPKRVRENIQRMVTLAGQPDRLRPHLKTSKSSDVTNMMLDAGITKFKCATIAECEMAALSQAPDVLLAYPLVGPNITRFSHLIAQYPQTKFSAVVDNDSTLSELSSMAEAHGQTISIFMDVNCGMNRTGIAPGPEARDLFAKISKSPGIIAEGFHVYDGHINNKELTERTQVCNDAMIPVWQLQEDCEKAGFQVNTMITGGTPTFPIHARNPNVECSPGTCAFWDASYTEKFPDLDFLPSALVITRVVSKPGPGKLCLDLGYKAIASENPHPRVKFLNCADAKATMHSEEHMVIETVHEYKVGDILYGVPWHVCPTVSLYSEAQTIENHTVSGTWKVTARGRRIAN